MTDQPMIDYILHLGDNALILGHRNNEWTGHGPILEQDIALSNIALDLIGQARNLYQYAARQINATGGINQTPQINQTSLNNETLQINQTPQINDAQRINQTPQIDDAQLINKTPLINEAPQIDGEGTTEDELAFLRDAWDFRNCLLVEQDNGDWGKTVLRQFFFSTYQYYFYQELQRSRDTELSAIAEKSLKEVTYHLRWCSEWVIRLGDGTDESQARMEKALDELWPFTGELFVAAAYEKELADQEIAVDIAAIKPQWEERVKEVLQQAQLKFPPAVWQQTGGKQGKHTEQLSYLLAEMQILQRSYPGCEW